ncbi:hypothetical protein [Kiritimatiella glycovorans]|uniref:Uncharacterized protein n=1 Tax=Kiritimatiella glycovorans TaxID=1307763 RepID=A0A0G3EHT2_9BACT|nr:hypothetical protein [Kiritimatiella glycovorans]AKJ63749.1 hypothetical protein L21SP4_00469 [Kiritimatiella glycovorans]
MKADELERYSSAVTLSDMEIFVFPRLLYALVLANIMSPLLWEWRRDRWFRKLDRKTPYRKVMRLKQFIMDHFEFNLDLETWGLTHKNREIERFSPFMDPEAIARSNALFGYQGDRYYFDIDIRRHFGLDSYEEDIIPYWKTETLEAMHAFRHKEGYTEGAGECVSLSTLYAAALFVVCRIPLEQIYLMATPLHSQNFIDVADGVLTNNRRVVTKTMWYNGTELSARAQRALRNERVTIVSHPTGWIHLIHPVRTIDEQAWDQFTGRLQSYLTRERIDYEVLANFLRLHREFQVCFQLRHEHHGKTRYLPAETAYHYEHASSYRVNDTTSDHLLSEIDEYEFYSNPLEGRICLQELADYLERNPIRSYDRDSLRALAERMQCPHNRAPEILERLAAFVHVAPRLPDLSAKRHETEAAIDLHPDMNREEVIDRLTELRAASATADLAFYAYRDLASTDWEPFMKAALERNPVCIEGAKDLTLDGLRDYLDRLPDDSIYDGTRAAQPDEVWNFGRGDGLEKAVTCAAVLRHRTPERPITLECTPERAALILEDERLEWRSSKGLRHTVEL